MSDSLDKLKKLTTDLEGKLLEEEKALLALTNIMNDGYWDWHIDTGYQYMSPKFWKILGYDPATKKHDPSEWRAIIHQDDLDKALDDFVKHKDSKGTLPYHLQVRYLCGKCGEYVSIICRGNIITWHDGEPIRMIGTHTKVPGSCGCG